MTDEEAAAALSPLDREGLQKCFDLVAGGVFGQVEAQEIRDALTSRGFFWSARHASFFLQVESLGLRPWHVPPCRSELAEPNSEARVLAERLRASGLSVYEPDPGRALAAVEQPLPAPKPKPRKRR
jgi:hypothetical protein